MVCDSGVDPTFYRAFMKQQRLREKDEVYRTRREEGFLGKNIDQIGDWLRTEGEIFSSTSPESPSSPVKSVRGPLDTPAVTMDEMELGVEGTKRSTEEEGDEERKKKRRLFTEKEEVSSDPLPLQYRHIRLSERKVKDEFYTTCGALSGEGLSLQESITAVLTVGNGLFGRQWKKYDEKEDSFDIDTAPKKDHLLEKLMQMEAQSLSMVVEEIRKGKEEGHMLTHASDSTTKRGVGQFIGQVGD